MWAEKSLAAQKVKCLLFLKSYILKNFYSKKSESRIKYVLKNHTNYYEEKVVENVYMSRFLTSLFSKIRDGRII